MMLTFQISPEDFVALNNTLKIKQSDFKFSETVGYALQILKARQALGMSNVDRDCCMDYNYDTEQYPVMDVVK